MDNKEYNAILENENNIEVVTIKDNPIVLEQIGVKENEI